MNYYITYVADGNDYRSKRVYRYNRWKYGACLQATGQEML